MTPINRTSGIDAGPQLVLLASMKDIQEVFSKLQELQKEQKEINKMYRDTLANDDVYCELGNKIKQLQERRREVQAIAQAEMGERYVKLEELKSEIQAHKEMMNDLAMRDLMAGKTVEVKDRHDNKYEPAFSVAFKKIN